MAGKREKLNKPRKIRNQQALYMRPPSKMRTESQTLHSTGKTGFEPSIVFKKSLQST